MSTGAGGSAAGGRTGAAGASGAAGATGAAGTTGAAGATGAGGTGGTVPNPPPITSGGTNGWASRYWDCCKPACGWTGNTGGRTPVMSCDVNGGSLGGNFNATNACDSGGSAYMCWSDVPWQVSPTLAYGFAAASGSNYVCGRCYQLQFTGTSFNGSNANTGALNGKTMIVQVINNGGVGSTQLDLLIPGGGVGAQTAACPRQFPNQDLGPTGGGFMASCNNDKNCVVQKCQTVFAGKADLLAGCNWFINWFNGADNPNLVYKQITCPAAITQRSGLSDPG
jgi:hypothetical protein